MAASLEIVRVLTQDTGTPPELSDPDINAIIGIEPNAYRAAAMAALSISAKFSARVDMGGGSSKLALSQQSEAYRKLAAELNRRAQTGGDGGTGVPGGFPASPVLTGTSIDTMNDLDRDDDRYQGSFKRGQDNNPPSRFSNTCPENY